MSISAEYPTCHQALHMPTPYEFFMAELEIFLQTNPAKTAVLELVQKMLLNYRVTFPESMDP